jgi:hypothetical protein
VAIVEQYRPLHFSADFRLLPLDDECNLAAESDANMLLTETLSVEGLRKSSIHLVPVHREEGWVRAVASVSQLEGRMRGFFRHGDRYYDDLLLAIARPSLEPSRWSPDGPVVDDDDLNLPWELPPSGGLELMQTPLQVTLVPTLQLDPAVIGQLEMSAYMASVSDGFGLNVLDPLVGQRPTQWDFGVADPETGSLIGRVGAVGLSERALHCGIRVLVSPEQQQRHVAFYASISFLHLMFSTLPLRKVYFDLSTPQTMRFAEALHEDLTLEAHLVDDYLLGSVYVDRFIWSIDRHQLAELLGRVNI